MFGDMSDGDGDGNGDACGHIASATSRFGFYSSGIFYIYTDS